MARPALRKAVGFATTPRVCVVPASCSDHLKRLAQQTAVKYGFAFVTDRQPAAPNMFEIVVAEAALSLVDTSKAMIATPFQLDLLQESRQRLRRGAVPEVVKAVGGPRRNSWLVDATAGSGADAAVCAQSGWKVTMIERHPVFACLLDDAVQRATAGSSLALDLVFGDSVAWLNDTTQRASSMDERPAVVYLDPMYPVDAHRKSSKSKRHAQVLQCFAGNGNAASPAHDSEEQTLALLQAALKCATSRVVLKRSVRSPPLLKPSFGRVGTTTRFDVYDCVSVKQ